MKSCLPSVCALVLCMSVTADAAATGDHSPATTAGKFVDALKGQRFDNAAAMFAPGEAADALATERMLARVGQTVGGFSAMQAIPTLPAGKSIKFAVPAHRTIAPSMQRFLQIRYASTASDGRPVFYELNLSAGDRPPQILSFDIHFPASGAESTARANKLVKLISR